MRKIHLSNMKGLELNEQKSKMVLKTRNVDFLFCTMTYFFWPVLILFNYYSFGWLVVGDVKHLWFLVLVLIIFSPITSIGYTLGSTITYVTAPRLWGAWAMPVLNIWISWIVSFLLFNIFYYLFRDEFPMKYFFGYEQSNSNSN